MLNNKFHEALHARGVPLPKEEVTPGKYTRWGDKYSAIMTADRKAIIFWAWDLSVDKFCVFDSGSSSQATDSQIQELQKRYAAEKRVLQQSATAAARILWEAASPCLKHPYLARKGVLSYGLKVDRRDVLLVPVLDKCNNIISLQNIRWNTELNKFEKRFLKNAPTDGWFIIPAESMDRIVVCEGYATAASIHQCTGLPVVVAFSCHKLVSMTQRLKIKYPNAEIIIAADNDTTKQTNTGLKCAREAAITHSTKLIYPDEGDFNDAHLEKGDDYIVQKFREFEFVTKGVTNTSVPTAAEILLENYRLTADGLYYVNNPKKPATLLCDYIRGVERLLDSETGDYYLKIEVGNDRKLIIIRRDALVTSGGTMEKILANHGFDFEISLGSSNKIKTYLMASGDKLPTILTSLGGWVRNDCFIWNGVCIGDNKEQIRPLQPAIYSPRGDIDLWRKELGAYVVEDSLLFVLAASLAAPLLKLTCVENFGVNIVGNSGTGKTTCLNVAATLVGGLGYKGTWNNTQNGLEKKAEDKNDLPLILDELGQANSKTVGSIIYMLGNGQGRGRMDISCQAIPVKHWRTVLISSGEVGVATKIAEGDGVSHVGQEIRLMDIPVELECPLGFKNVSQWISHLTNVLEKVQAVAYPYFVDKITKLPAGKVLNNYKQAVEYFRSHFSKLSSQEERALQKFALMSVAGGFAEEFGMFKSPPRFFISVFKMWCKSRPQIIGEDGKILSVISHYLQTNQLKLFVNKSELQNGFTPNTQRYVSGFFERDGRDEITRICIFTSVFKKDICSQHGIDYMQALIVLKERQLLITTSDSDMRCGVRVGGLIIKVYSLCPQILEGELA